MKTCRDCGKPITRYATRCRSCANRLRSQGRTGTSNNRWKGGVIERAGRIHIYDPGNPLANGKGYARRARLVLAEKLGRPLTPEEICHHINGDPKDDRPGNLRLFRNHSAHTKHHRRMHFIERERYRLVLDLLERIHLGDRNK